MRKGTHGYTSYAKLVLLELALYDVPVQSTFSLFRLTKSGYRKQHRRAEYAHAHSICRI